MAYVYTKSKSEAWELYTGYTLLIPIDNVRRTRCIFIFVFCFFFFAALFYFVNSKELDFEKIGMLLRIHRKSSAIHTNKMKFDGCVFFLFSLIETIVADLSHFQKVFL